MSYIEAVRYKELILGRKLSDLEVIDLIFTTREKKNADQEYTSDLHSKVSVDKILSITNLERLSYKLNPSLNLRSAYLLLDTDNIDTTLSTTYNFTWQFLNYISLSTGTVNSTGKIRDIVAMRIFPVKTNVVTSILGPDYNNKVMYNQLTTMNGNFTVLIDEFKSQSYIGRNGRRFHFILFPYVMNLITYNVRQAGPPFTYAVLPADPYIEFTTSGKANGWFYFRKPITNFTTLTVSIGNPFDLMSLTNNGRTLIPLEFVYKDEAEDN